MYRLFFHLLQNFLYFWFSYYFDLLPVFLPSFLSFLPSLWPSLLSFLCFSDPPFLLLKGHQTKTPSSFVQDGTETIHVSITYWDRRCLRPFGWEAQTSTLSKVRSSTYRYQSNTAPVHCGLSYSTRDQVRRRWYRFRNMVKVPLSHFLRQSVSITNIQKKPLRVTVLHR